MNWITGAFVLLALSFMALIATIVIGPYFVWQIPIYGIAAVFCLAASDDPEE